MVSSSSPAPFSTSSSAPADREVPIHSYDREFVASSSSRTKEREQRQCSECINLLQQVLDRGDSKPAQLLRSMSAVSSSSSPEKIAWRKSPNGIQVEIPAATAQDSKGPTGIIEADPDSSRSSSTNSLIRRLTSSRSWAKGQTDGDIGNTGATPQLAATSTRAESNSVGSNNSSSSSSGNDNKTEWMSLQCRPCQDHGAESNARAFVMGPTPLSVVVCSNRLQQQTQQEMAEIITHELVHIFDVRRLHLNLLDCHKLAYSEVRAAREAECATASSSFTDSWFAAPFGKTLQHCARQKATVATRNLFPEAAKQCIDTVFDEAFRDTRPFAQENDNGSHSPSTQTPGTSKPPQSASLSSSARSGSSR